MPYYMHFEPTTRCNMSCIYCTRGTLGEDNLKTDISIERIKSIVNSNKNLLEVNIQGLGEPMMAKNFEEVVNFLFSKNLYLTTYSNGTTLRRNKNHRNLLLNYFNNVTISIDTLNQKLADIVRPGGNIEDILAGIKLLSEERKATGSKLKISAMIVLTETNYKDIEETVKVLDESGVDHFAFNELDNLKAFGEEGWFELHNNAINFRKNRMNVLDSLAKIKVAEGKTIFNPDLKFSGPLKGNCDWGFYRIFITANGYLTPCCKRMEDNHKLTSNKLDSNFNSIWNNEDLQHFRKTHLMNLTNKFCDYCPN